jgi:hypothetical protein
MLFYTSLRLGFNPEGKHALRVYGNKVLRVFGLEEEEIARGWIKSCNEELHNLCCFVIF